VTFADGVLRLVKAGARIELRDDVPVREQPADLVDAMLAAPAALPETAEGLDFADTEAVSAEASERLTLTEPGLSDLEAAVALVSGGLAERVILSGFQSWPGLLWRAYQLADTTGVLILPTVVRPGGRVDIVITRDNAPHG
jgi:hypothetical protein